MAKETYYYGQGKVYLAVILANGTLDKWRWVGDVSSLSGSMQETAITHEESFSGKKGRVREFFISPQLNMSATLHSLNPENYALFTQGTATAEEAGVVASEPLMAGLEPGDVVMLNNPGVTDLVITDSAGTPVELDEEHYILDPRFGSIELVSLPETPPTQPFIAAYSFAANTQVSFLSANTRPNVALRYEGINLAEGGAPVIMELYKMSPSLLQELSMITDGNQVAGMPIALNALLDTSKPANGPLGQYGRIIQVEAA